MPGTHAAALALLPERPAQQACTPAPAVQTSQSSSTVPAPPATRPSSRPHTPTTLLSSSEQAAVKRLAADIKWMSWNAGWHAANSLARCDDAARGDLARFEHHAASISKELPPELATHIRSMVWSACWHAANTRGVALRGAASVMDEGEEEGEEDEEEEAALMGRAAAAVLAECSVEVRSSEW